MIHLTLVRHLKTSWNSEGKLQGRADISILPDQADTIRRLKRSLKASSYDLVFTSQLGRTQETAIACGYGDRAEASELLNEIDFGDWEGRPASELRSTTSWMDNPREVELGESFDRFVARVTLFLRQLLEYGEGRVLVFGHGAWIRCGIALIEKGQPGSMNRVVIEHGEPYLIRFDEHNVIWNEAKPSH